MMSDQIEEASAEIPQPEPGPMPGPVPWPAPGPVPGPLPAPIPGPLPYPEPLPKPWPAPEWWRCLRIGPVSGRYEGSRTTPVAGGELLDLRVDVDPRYANSPVLDRVSGDFYTVYSIRILGRIIRWRVYRESWIVDSPRVTWSRCSVEVTGSVRFWKGVHPATTARIVIPWGTFRPAGPAQATFTPAGGAVSAFSCPRQSHCFRTLTLEADVCRSVNAEPVLPTYDTHAHTTRPAGLPQRSLTFEEAYREAGICVTVNPMRTEIDDSAATFATWTDAELHDAMETNFSRYPGAWPKWDMWGVMAGSYVSSSVAGIMFDYGAAFGGPGRAPERQGFAVFRNHFWFNSLVAGAPANQTEAWAMRQFLYTWVHEAGHAFNFLHSWNKGRPNALSWMNYPQNVANFWNNFEFRFDDEELIHIRHGDRSEVIPGGDPWSTGGHLEGAMAFAQAEGEVPLELLVRSKRRFDLLEPVAVELRLRNLLPDLPLELDTRLHPDFGVVAVFVRRPDGRVVEYLPIACKLGTPETRVLHPQGGAEGEDRYSERVLLSFGRRGFYFDEPGEYLVRAIYQGTGDALIPSNVHRIHVGPPTTRDEDELAARFFTPEVGMALYLGGSASPFLERGMEVLEELADRYSETEVGAKTAEVVAQGVGRPFFRIEDNQLTETHAGDPQRAVDLTTPAREFFRRDQRRELNLDYHRLARQRSEYLTTMGETEQAKEELSELREDLAARDVNEPVLEEIRAYEESL